MAPQYFGAPGTPVTFSVTALDRAGQAVTDYTGTVEFLSPTDHSAKFLARTYTFTAADQGSHAFPDGVNRHSTVRRRRNSTTPSISNDAIRR